MGKRVGIVAAVNGGMQRDREGAKVPITPEEIAEDAALCFNEGAAVVHIHARDAQGNNSSDVAIYQDIIRRIRAACGISSSRQPTASVFAAIQKPESSCGHRMRTASRSSRLFRNPIFTASRRGRSISIIRKAGIRSRRLRQHSAFLEIDAATCVQDRFDGRVRTGRGQRGASAGATGRPGRV